MPKKGSQVGPTERRRGSQSAPMVAAIRVLKKGQSTRRKRELQQNVQERWPQEESWEMTKDPGWVALPKEFPLVMSILDELVGKNVGRVYLALFAQTWEGVPLVTIRDEDEMALWAGFRGPARRYTFRKGLALLEALGFIRIIGLPGEVRDVLLRKPAVVIAELRGSGKVSAASSQSYRFWDHVQAYRKM